LTSEYGSKERRSFSIVINRVILDVFRNPQNNNESIAVKFCTACSNTLMHFVKISSIS